MMDERDFEGTIVLEQLASIAQVETIAIAVKKMQAADG